VTDGALWIDLVNAGRTGAVFQVFDNTDRDAPWRFTLAAAEKYAAGHWNRAGRALGAFDLTVHGPNGFYRRFAGDTARPQPVISVAADSRWRLVISLKGAGVATLRMADDYPLSDGEARQTVTLPAKGTVRSVWDLRGSDHWYDLIVTLADDPSFTQRLAGHLETGRPSRTDPGIGRMRL
jgi:phospholipase C